MRLSRDQICAIREAVADHLEGQDGIKRLHLRQGKSDDGYVMTIAKIGALIVLGQAGASKIGD